MVGDPFREVGICLNPVPGGFFVVVPPASYFLFRDLGGLDLKRPDPEGMLYLWRGLNMKFIVREPLVSSYSWGQNSPRSLCALMSISSAWSRASLWAKIKPGVNYSESWALEVAGSMT
jgi:hypothetical protein